MEQVEQDVLRQHGIEYREEANRHLVLEHKGISPEDLRRLGFRLGRGWGNVRYLLYYRCRFCGVMI